MKDNECAPLACIPADTAGCVMRIQSRLRDFEQKIMLLLDVPRGRLWTKGSQAMARMPDPVWRPWTTLYGQVVVSDANIYSKPTNDYEQFVNAFVGHEWRGRGRAKQKHAADQAWWAASDAEKWKLIEDEKSLSSTPSNAMTFNSFQAVMFVMPVRNKFSLFIQW